MLVTCSDVECLLAKNPIFVTTTFLERILTCLLAYKAVVGLKMAESERQSRSKSGPLQPHLKRDTKKAYTTTSDAHPWVLQGKLCHIYCSSIFTGRIQVLQPHRLAQSPFWKRSPPLSSPPLCFQALQPFYHQILSVLPVRWLASSRFHHLRCLGHPLVLCWAPSISVSVMAISILAGESGCWGFILMKSMLQMASTRAERTTSHPASRKTYI